MRNKLAYDMARELCAQLIPHTTSVHNVDLVYTALEALCGEIEQICKIEEVISMNTDYTGRGDEKGIPGMVKKLEKVFKERERMLNDKQSLVREVKAWEASHDALRAARDKDARQHNDQFVRLQAKIYDLEMAIKNHHSPGLLPKPHSKFVEEDARKKMKVKK